MASASTTSEPAWPPTQPPTSSTWSRSCQTTGVSGKSLSGRGGLQQVLAALRAGEADGLVVAKLDRLSRSVRDVLDLVDEAGRRGWQLHSIAEHLDTSTASGRFTLTVLAGLAQMEREQVAERTRAALAHLRSQGKRTSGRAPFGYRFEAGHEVEAPVERPALARILELRADGLGPRRLARALADEQLPNPRTGRAFTPGTLQAIVRTAERRARA